MNVKRINDFFGYAIFTLGVAKILFVVLVIIKLGANLTAIFNGGNASNEYFPNLIAVMSISEVILVFGSIIMIFVNIKKQPEVIPGYLLILGGALVGFIFPSALAIFGLFVQTGMYMKAGSKIRNKSSLSELKSKTSKKTIKNTEWFYLDQKERTENVTQEENNVKSIVENDIAGKIPEKKELKNIYYNEEPITDIEKKRLVIIFAVSLLIAMLIIFICIWVIENKRRENIRVAEVATVSINSIDSIDDNDKVELVGQETASYIDDRLIKMKDIFNNSKMAQSMIEQGYTMNAIVLKDGISIYSGGKGVSFNVDFNLNNNILSSNIYYGGIDPEIAAIELYLAVLFVDSAGQMRGYQEGELVNALGKEEFINYTIENEGVEIKKVESESKVEVRLDLNNDLSFLNN